MDVIGGNIRPYLGVAIARCNGQLYIMGVTAYGNYSILDLIPVLSAESIRGRERCACSAHEFIRELGDVTTRLLSLSV